MNENSINDSNILNSDRNKKEENFYYFKLTYIIITTIICFLGILTIFENLNLVVNKSQNKTESLVLFYIIYSSFSWLFIYVAALVIFKIAQFFTKNNSDNLSEESNDNLALKCITKENTNLNKSNNLNEFIFNNNNINNVNTENNNAFELMNVDSKDKNNNNYDKNKNISTNNISRYAFSGNVKDQLNKNTKLNLFKNENNNISHNFINDDLENNSVYKNNYNSANKDSVFFNFPNSQMLKLIYLILLLLNYSIFSIFGTVIFVKLIKEEIFKNYKLFYKIYLFMLLSVSKSAIIIIGFIYKFVSKHIESNSVKFELNEEFLQQIEKEIQEANRISGVISPDKNLIKFNEMFNRQDFSINKSNVTNNDLNNNKEKNSQNKNLNDIENPNAQNTEFNNDNNNNNDINSHFNLINKGNISNLDDNNNTHKNISKNEMDNNSKENNNENIINKNKETINENNNFDKKEQRNIFNFKIQDKINNTVNNKEVKNNIVDYSQNKKINFKLNSDKNFVINKFYSLWTLTEIYLDRAFAID